MAAPRVGVFGGAFDPPHLAHAALVQAAVAQLGLSQVRVLPTGHAWHKARTLSPAVHRLAMTKLAFAGVPEAVVDERELHRAGPTYTADTLAELGGELAAKQPTPSLWLLMGQDQWLALPTWRRWREVACLAQLAVARRGEGALVMTFTKHPIAAELKAQAVDMPLMDVSATRIRQLAQQGASLSGLVSRAVERYIAQHHLYR